MSAERLRVRAAASSIDTLELEREPDHPPEPSEDEIVIEIAAAAVNPSDVKATLGAMPHAVWPRTPGRDWAGVVIAGPPDQIGQEVFGTGGELGIRRDGSHASFLRLHRDAAVPKPATLSLAEASTLGVPFVTAWQGLSRAGLPNPDDTVLVLGVNGKVGQAVAQIATARGARVFGVTRRAQSYLGHASREIRMIDASREDVAAVVRAATSGHGADIAYNTVGSPYFAAANAALAQRGRQIFIATVDRAVPFDILAFYRAQLTYVGIDSLALDSVACARILRELLPGFENGELRPFPVHDAARFALADAISAYRAVLDGAPARIVLIPAGVRRMSEA